MSVIGSAVCHRFPINSAIFTCLSSIPLSGIDSITPFSMSVIGSAVCHRFPINSTIFAYYVIPPFLRTISVCLSSFRHFAHHSIDLYRMSVSIAVIPPFLHMSIIGSAIFAHHSIDLYNSAIFYMSVIDSAVWNRFYHTIQYVYHRFCHFCTPFN